MLIGLFYGECIEYWICMYNTELMGIFQEHFLNELDKKEHGHQIYYSLKEQKIYDFKYEQMKDLFAFFNQIKDMGLYVRKQEDYDFYVRNYSKELEKFDYFIQDASSAISKPSPCIFIKNPLKIEISLKTTDDLADPIYIVEIYSQHPDKNMLKSQYFSLNELCIDFSHFFSKNMFKNQNTK